ncbi:T9SS type A sorting domain-containing protein [Empedobacter brevis]
MKTKLHLLILFTVTLIPFFNPLHAQVLEWSALFNVHSAGTGAGINPNSLVDPNGKITTVVIENDTLKLYQTLGNGTSTNMYTTNKNIEGNYTPLVRVENNEQALVFKANPFPGSFWLLQTDADLNVTREAQLQFPPGMPFIDIQHLIAYNGELYLSFFSQPFHYLCKINNDNTLTVVYSGSYEIAFGEAYILLDNGNIIFFYKSGNGHIIRCVSVENGGLVWEQSINTNHGILLDYKVVKNGNTVYAVGKERAWVNGEANDKVLLSHIDVSSGAISFQEPLNLPTCNNCGSELNDFLYNPVNNHLYLTYESGNSETAVWLIEMDNQSAEITGVNNFPFETELNFFQLTKRSVTHIRPDGRLVVMYKSYKNVTEQMNLYIMPLNFQLEPLGTFEFHIEEPESTEHPTDVLNYDTSRIVITGIVPHKEPSISVEQVEYFTAMFNLEEILSTENPAGTVPEVLMYPNPAHHQVNFMIPDGAYKLTVYNTLGKIMHKENLTQNTFHIDVSSYQPGTYFVHLSGQQGEFHTKLIVK